MLRRSKYSQFDDQSKDHFDPKRSPKMKHPQQQYTDNISAYDMKNTNSTY